MDFVVRVDLESEKGISQGLPKLLDLFKKQKVKGSFYLTMGGESGIFDLLRYRGSLPTAGERKIKIFSIFEKLRIILFPRDFVKSNEKVIRRILLEGHELGIHGWKHRRWTRGFEKIDKTKDIDLAINRYKELFGREPKSFSAPGFRTGGEVISYLDTKGITHFSDLKKEEKSGKLKNVPITLLGENNTPFIEYWVGEGKTDKEILEIFKKSIKGKKFVSFYLHGLFEGIQKISLLEKILIELKKRRGKSKRIIDIK